MNEFSENDRKEAERLKAQVFCYSNPSEIFEQCIETLKDRLAFGHNGGIFTFLFSLQSNFLGFGIAQRIISKDVSLLVECLGISARFGYIQSIIDDEEEHSGQHVFVLLKMLAIGDDKAIRILTQRHPAPFKKGHSDTILLCHAIYAALDKHPPPTLMIKALEQKKSTVFFKSMYQCVLAVMKEDKETFFQNIRTLLKNNRRQDFHSSMEKTICIEAHALVRLWSLKNPSELLDLSSLSLPWDQAFYEYTINQTVLTLPEFIDVSPVIKCWLKNMPDKVNKNEIMEELREGIWKRLRRRIKVARRENKLNKARRLNG